MQFGATYGMVHMVSNMVFLMIHFSSYRRFNTLLFYLLHSTVVDGLTTVAVFTCKQNTLANKLHG